MSKRASNSKIMPWFTAVLMVAGIAVLAALYWNKNVTVQDLRVNDLVFLDYETIKKTANIPEGVKPDSLDLDVLITRIEKLDYVKKAAPYIEPSGRLRINIKEREPIALLMSRKERAYVDEEGVILPILDEITLDLPLLYGFKNNAIDTLKGDDFKQISEFLISARENEFGWLTISEVAFDQHDGVVALSHENGVKLMFGRYDFDAKFKNWEAFYAQIVKTKGIQTMQQVDLRFLNQVVTREI